LVEEGLGYLAKTWHSDGGVTLQRFTKQGLRFLAIAWGGSIHQHHCVKAACLRLFEAEGQRLNLLHCHLKMFLSSFPLTYRCRSDARDRLSQAGIAQRAIAPVYEYGIDLWATSHVFKAGHRLRLEDSSSNFP